MTPCHYCGIERVTAYGVYTRLGHAVDLCERCAAVYGIVAYRPRRVRPPARDGPPDRQRELLPER